MTQFVDSLKRFALILILLVIAALSSVFLFDRLINPAIGLTASISQAIKTLILLAFGSIVILIIRRSKPVLSRTVGIQPATIFQSFMILVVTIVIVFAFLQIFQVSPTTLLIGGGIVSIVIGLVISTFVGNILAGALVLMTNPFRVGDVVLVNNVPGRVEEITVMVTRIRNDLGGLMAVPNSAIVQGGVVVTKFRSLAQAPPSRLPYRQGDRVVTTYMSGEGVVRELTSFHTKVLLDSGRELVFLNSSVLSGSVAIARIDQVPRTDAGKV